MCNNLEDVFVCESSITVRLMRDRRDEGVIAHAGVGPTDMQARKNVSHALPVRLSIDAPSERFWKRLHNRMAFAEKNAFK